MGLRVLFFSILLSLSAAYAESREPETSHGSGTAASGVVTIASDRKNCSQLPVDDAKKVQEALSDFMRRAANPHVKKSAAPSVLYKGDLGQLQKKIVVWDHELNLDSCFEHGPDDYVELCALLLGPQVKREGVALVYQDPNLPGIKFVKKQITRDGSFGPAYSSSWLAVDVKTNQSVALLGPPKDADPSKRAYIGRAILFENEVRYHENKKDYSDHIIYEKEENVAARNLTLDVDSELKKGDGCHGTLGNPSTALLQLMAEHNWKPNDALLSTPLIKSGVFAFDYTGFIEGRDAGRRGVAQGIKDVGMGGVHGAIFMGKALIFLNRLQWDPRAQVQFAAAIEKAYPTIKKPVAECWKSMGPFLGICLDKKIGRKAAKAMLGYIGKCVSDGVMGEEFSRCLGQGAAIVASAALVGGGSGASAMGIRGAITEFNAASGTTSAVVLGSGRAAGVAAETLLNQAPVSPETLAKTTVEDVAKNGAKLVKNAAKTLKSGGQETAEHGRIKGRAPEDAIGQKSAAEVTQFQKLAWYESRLKTDMQSAIDQRLNLQSVLKDGLKPGEKVYWLQQRGLKELNDVYFEIGGTEYLLMAIDDRLAQLLKEHPEFGSIIHNNYKDTVIVSKLSPQELTEKVIKPVRDQVVKDIKELKPELGNGMSWDHFLENHLTMADGDSMEQAFLKLHPEAGQKGFAAWKDIAQQKRQKILNLMRSPRAPTLEEILGRSRDMKNDPMGFTAWLKSKGLNPMIKNLIDDYREHLKAFDFLPLPKDLTPEQSKLLATLQIKIHDGSINNLPVEELGSIRSALSDSWIFQRSIFLSQAKDAQTIIATDIRGLGKRGLIAQDRFVADPARGFSDLPHIYDGTSDFLKDRYRTVYNDLKKILPKDTPLAVFRSGDDALWAIPKVSPEVRAKVIEYFAQLQDLYTAVASIEKPGNAESLSGAILRARDAVFGNHQEGISFDHYVD